MNTVSEVVMSERARLNAERRAMDELGFGDDLVALARMHQQFKFVRDVMRAYAHEIRAQSSRLPRAEIRAALHDALAATERDDLDELTAAMLRVADVLGKGRA